MSTTIRPNISPTSKYWISKHRYYELKHYALQYPEWRQLRNSMQLPSFNKSVAKSYGSSYGDPVGDYVELLDILDSRLHTIEQSCKDADPELSNYILKAVTEGVSYSYLSTVMGIPCCRDTFYDRYRRFYYILSTVRR